MFHIPLDRYLRDEYKYLENVGIGGLVTEKFFNYFPYVEKVSCPLFYSQYLGFPLNNGVFYPVTGLFVMGQVWI